MGVPPESLEVGKCYLTKQGRVRRVIAIESGKVTYHFGQQKALKFRWPRRMVATQATFAASVVSEVTCPAYLVLSEKLAHF